MKKKILAGLAIVLCVMIAGEALADLSFSKVWSRKGALAGGVREGGVDITLDANYATGGWTINASDLGLTYIHMIDCPGVGGYVFRYNPSATTSGKLLAYEQGALSNQNVAIKGAVQFYKKESWAIDGDGAETNGAGMVGEVTLTEQAAAMCKSYDATNTEYQNCATSSAGTDMTNDYQFFSDTKADGDAVFFGCTVPCAEIAIDMSATVQNYTGNALTWYYYDGTDWTSTLSIVYDGTDATAQDGLQSFQQDGAISWIPPSDWATAEVDSQTAYWVKAEITTTANIGANEAQTNSKEHEIVTTDGYVAPRTETITKVWVVDQAATVHTAADVKFILVNHTSGAVSEELTWPQDHREYKWTLSSPLAATEADVIGILVTQEDGTNEIGPANINFITSGNISAVTATSEGALAECDASESGLNSLVLRCEYKGW